MGKCETVLAHLIVIYISSMFSSTVRSDIVTKITQFYSQTQYTCNASS